MDAPDRTAPPEWCSVAEAARVSRRHRPDAPGWQILADIERAAATGKIRTRGRRRLYQSDRPLPIAHDNPDFVWSADRESVLSATPEAIPAVEWSDMALFSRRTYTGVPYAEGLAQAIDAVDCVDELRSRSRGRLAWAEVELCRADMIRAYGAVGTEPVPAPFTRKSIPIEPRGALQQVCGARGCSVDEAGELLTGLANNGRLAITYLNGEPESCCWLIQFPNTDRRGDEIARRFDWHRGLDVRTYKLYPEIRPTREEAMRDLFAALDAKYGLAERQRGGGENPDAYSEGLVEIAYPFHIADREQLISVAGGLAADAVNFAVAMQLLAPVMGEHYPELESKRTLVKGAKDERLIGYGKPDRMLHYEALPASLWKRCQIVPDGGGNYDLRGNHNAIPSVFCDIHFSRAEIGRYQNWLSASCDRPGHAARVLEASATLSPQPSGAHAAPGRRASPAVQAMRDAYKRLVSEKEITTATIGKERFNKVNDSEEVKEHIKQAGTERGLSQDTFEREVLRAEWPGKPRISASNP